MSDVMDENKEKISKIQVKVPATYKYVTMILLTLPYLYGHRDQGPIIQVWPSGQITLIGRLGCDVIGSKRGTVRYDATMVFRDLAIKLVELSSRNFRYPIFD